MHLFATRGFKGTTVGAIESAVGLQPRRGALYRHFASKEALLDAAVARHLDAVATGADQLASLDFGTIDLDLARAVVIQVGRWFLDELDRQADLARILQREGDRLPALRDLARARIIDAGYGAAAGLVRAAAPVDHDAADADGAADPDALAVVLMGSLAGLRHTTWTFGAAPLGVDDERVLEIWADLCVGALRDLRDRGRPPGP